MPVRGPLLALDYGAKYIGLAVSDADAKFSFPLTELERRDEKRDREALCALAAERGVVQLVVGLPLHMDGRAGPEAEAARAFAKALGEASGLPVALLDERWTTQEARRSLRAVQPRRKKRERSRVDSAAASLLLQTFIDRSRHAGDRE